MRQSRFELKLEFMKVWEGECDGLLRRRSPRFAQTYFNNYLFEVRTSVMRQLASAVGYLHDKGILHRDIKPQNVLLDKDGSLKLSDFGLAKDLSASSKAYSLVGSPYYIAPELIQLEPYGRPTDVFSLGTTIIPVLKEVPSSQGFLDLLMVICRCGLSDHLDLKRIDFR